ncbi:hypothetical protein SAMN02799625_02866 [Methylobacterium sp. UNC300MFChir4.1]|uniref:hypothetical protein n=1 Tax=Methylobacterium sp. UNC300MFChir4.1 TaxID=1502747 RepID=UPI0008B2E521|nr:hypothetical protein [Methylobacterium sp. UNC300MFChir4.1]SEO27428.1 hypothetical protein SAMN02799625_02866 [Methylobacterium sp. UNC300MFChir4.1]
MAGNRMEEAWRPAFKTGQIFFGHPQECCDCLIWELRTSGARIEVQPEAVPPQAVRLVSIALLLNQPCEVVAREGRTIELRFSPRPEPAGGAPDATRPVLGRTLFPPHRP